MPPGFWELYNGEASCGVTVHSVVETLDAGSIIASSAVPISPLETPDSLLVKLHLEAAHVLATAVDSLQTGSEAISPREPDKVSNANTKPTRRQVEELAIRLPHWRRPKPTQVIAKNLMYLAMYHCGIHALARRRNLRRKTRGAILLYHRVNDISADPLTANLEQFAEHLLLLKRWYRPEITKRMVDALLSRQPVPPTSVAIHFDDCYRDIYSNAAPLLKAAGIPATAFINPGFIGTDRVFLHDQAKSPFRFPNLSVEDLRGWMDLGFDIGAHTINHVNLGQCSLEDGTNEIIGSGEQLEQLIQRPVRFFSFPFGKLDNLREEFRPVVKSANYRALFAAHGGFLDENTNCFDIPRMGISGEHKPLYLLFELEGLGMQDLRRLVG